MSWRDIPKNASDASGLGMIQYVAGNTYNNVALTVTGTAWTTLRAVFVPYSMTDGTWRMKFNIVGTVTSSSRNAYQVTVSGVTFKTLSGYNQSINVFTSVVAGAHVVQGGGIMATFHASSSTIEYEFSGDVELDSKPLWAS